MAIYELGRVVPTTPLVPSYSSRNGGFLPIRKTDATLKISHFLRHANLKMTLENNATCTGQEHGLPPPQPPRLIGSTAISGEASAAVAGLLRKRNPTLKNPV